LASRVVACLAALTCLLGAADIAAAPERPLSQQPYPDAAEYASAAESLAHDKGFFTYIHAGQRQPPRYPPGYPFALAPFAAAGTFPHAVQRGATFYAILYFLATMLAAWVLGGPLAALLAGVFVLASPFARDSGGLILSDALVAALTVLALPLLRTANRPRARLAGATTGLAMLARLTASVNLVALLVSWPRRSLRSLLAFALPALVGLGLLQWALFGSPIKTGYSYWGVAGHSLSAAYLTSADTLREQPFIFPDRLEQVCGCGVEGARSSLANLPFYPLVLAGVLWIFSPPLVPLAGLVYAWRRRREPVGRYALVLTGLSLVLFWCYRFQGARFVAGPATVLTVLAAVALAEHAGRAWPRAFASPRPDAAPARPGVR
jgi:4-amino-4-deoxy-L-arabinose transferase-like glycosyltransferase